MADDIRACPACGQPQEWCTRPDCYFVPGHWSHVGEPLSCDRLGDRNRESGGDYLPPIVQDRFRYV